MPRRPSQSGILIDGGFDGAVLLKPGLTRRLIGGSQKVFRVSDFPRMCRVRQTFDAPRIGDVAAAARAAMESLSLSDRIRPGQTVAVTAGSRGIANIDVITRAIVDHLHAIGAAPFIVPAMGSHGGATAEGQVKLLATLGITPGSMGCEIRSSMETIVVDRTPQGIPVHFDRNAASADHVLLCNRVKPHTGFVGEIESGLHKMMLIGLGKHQGAVLYHQAIKDYSFGEILQSVAQSVLEKCRIVGAVAIVENALDETALVVGARPENLFEVESRLLRQAKAWLPRLPFGACDLLIIDQIGKNISGTGMDTNVVGRKYNDHAATDQDDASCRRIFIRGLTAATKGQATGIGLAEFTNRRTLAAIDIPATYVNCITSGHPTAGMLPMAYETDREVISEALQTVGLTPPPQARVIQIQDTLHLEQVLVSEAYLPELAGRSDLTLLDGPAPMKFDAAGNLVPVID
jgi:hypothetical protein